MFKWIVVVIVGALAVFALIASRQPDEFSVSRSTVMQAPAVQIYLYVNNASAWQAWSPWVEMDPEAVYTYSGPVAGVGATTHWEGDKSGTGTSTITASSLDRIDTELKFEKPMKSEAISSFIFEPAPEGTKVTWTMEGKQDFVGKAVGLLMNCQKMIGEQFDKGLANLKKLVEAAPQ